MHAYTHTYAHTPTTHTHTHTQHTRTHTHTLTHTHTQVLLAYKQYPVVPYQLTVCKRLSQCLHPNLPGGVHLKVLDVYRAIFTRLGTDGLAHNLLVYSSGLFPLMSYASMSVRPSLLDVYEKHYLPLGADLNPSLHGFALGLLPGLEDESEHTERITHLLDAVATATDRSMFFSALWSCVLYSSDVRLQAVGYILSKLNRRVTAEDQMDCLGGNLPLVVCVCVCLCACVCVRECVCLCACMRVRACMRECV